MADVYGASVLFHATFWISNHGEEKDRWPGVKWTARWPFLVAQGFTDSSINSSLFWQYDMADISNAEVVMVFAQPKDHLRGALVEAGIALGQNKPVLLVGSNPGFGSWQHHPMVFKADSLDAAAEWLRLWDARKPQEYPLTPEEEVMKAVGRRAK